MKKIFAILIILTLGILQSTTLDYVKISRVKPDILLISVIFFSLCWGPNFGLIIGFISGLLEDVLSASFIGINILSFGLCGLIIGAGGNKIYKDSLLLQSLVSFIAALSISLFSFCLFSLISGGVHPFVESFKHTIFPASLYTAAVSPAIFFVLSKVFGKPRFS
jgi:rod shape-determining protein MreD